jgi:molybdopterin-synthase adenylyltransferase
VQKVRPLFKKSVYIRRIPFGSIRLGELCPENAVEIEDEDGTIEAVIQLMDGTRTIDEIHREIVERYPKVTMEDINTLLEELDRFGYVDDCSKRDREGLAAYELERGKANLNYLSHFSTLHYSPWAMLQKMKNARVTIIGVGTLGSGVLLTLAGFGVSFVRIVDFDTVELSNLNRQMLFQEQDIGCDKIEAAIAFINRFHSKVKVEGVKREIRSVEEAKSVIDGCDLVVLAADQPSFQLERWVNQACVHLGVPFVGGGINQTRGQFYTVIPGETGCIDCNHFRQNIQNPEYADFVKQYLASPFRMPSAALMSNYMQVTGMLCGDIARLLTGYAPVVSKGKVVETNFVTFESAISLTFDHPIDECPTCGNGNGQENIFKIFREWASPAK